jgi:hypothetical protein
MSEPPRFAMPPTTPPSYRNPNDIAAHEAHLERIRRFERVQELRRLHGLPPLTVPGEIPELPSDRSGGEDPLAILLPSLTPANIVLIRRTVDPAIVETIIRAIRASRRAVPSRSSVVPPRRGGKSTRRLKSERNKRTRRHVR